MHDIWFVTDTNMYSLIVMIVAYNDGSGYAYVSCTFRPVV